MPVHISQSFLQYAEQAKGEVLGYAAGYTGAPKINLNPLLLTEVSAEGFHGHCDAKIFKPLGVQLVCQDFDIGQYL